MKIGPIEIVSGRKKPIEAMLVKIFCVFFVVWLLSGCSTIAQVGDLEVLNDVGLSEAGEMIRAVESSRVRLGGKPTPTGDAAVVNRTVGEVKQIEDKTSVPSIIQSVQYIFQNVDGLQ